MGTTADKLALLKANKESIRDAITEKIGEDAGAVMSTYAEKIRSIESKPKYYRTTILLDQTITDPATMVTKVYDDGGIAMIRANSHRYVCKLVDGVLEAKQLQDGNGTLYLDGTTADLTGGEGDVFMKLPQFYWKISAKTDIFVIDFVYGEKPSDDYQEWAGKDFIGVYESSIIDSMMYSRSGVESTGNLSYYWGKNYAANRGDGFSMVRWEHHCMMALLFYAYYLNTNCQTICGAGVNSYNKVNGQTDLLGMEDTAASVNGNAQSINFWGLENWWGNKSEWIGNVQFFWASTYFRVDTVDNDHEYTTIVVSKSGYGSKISLGDNKINLFPKEIAASQTTGYCDYLGVGTADYLHACRSGYQSYESGGVNYIRADYINTDTQAYITSRLSYVGEYKIIE